MPSAYLGVQVCRKLPQQLLGKSNDSLQMLLKIFGCMVKLLRKQCALILAAKVNKSIYATAKNGTQWHHNGKATEGMCVCVCVSVARRAPLSIPCSLHFPCKALVFSPCLLNELLLCGNWRSSCVANKELQGLSRPSSVPLSIFLPSFFFPCPPHYALGLLSLV